jgi:hypothetical protein
MRIKVIFLLSAVILFSVTVAHATFDDKMVSQYSVTSKVTDIDAVKCQKRFDYNSSGLILYKGVAASGVLSSSGNWLLFKYTYNDSDYSTSPDYIQTGEGSWTGRTSVTYQEAK